MESPSLSALHINNKEVMAMVMAMVVTVERCAPLWANKHVILQSDNQAAVGIINKGSCKNPAIMEFLRRIFWLSAILNFRLTTVYIRGSY